MDIERTPLPGVGVRYTFTNRRGQRLGVVSHLDGRHDVIIYDPKDPERALHTIVLELNESRRIAELLDATVTIDYITELERLEGVTVTRIPIRAGSPCDRHPIADTEARTRTSIIAVIRDEQAIPAPGPEFVLRHGDVVVAAGDQDGVDALVRLLTER